MLTIKSLINFLNKHLCKVPHKNVTKTNLIKLTTLHRINKNVRLFGRFPKWVCYIIINEEIARNRSLAKTRAKSGITYTYLLLLLLIKHGNFF